MPITIKNKGAHQYLITGEQLHCGQIYEGSDGELYVGTSLLGSEILAVGINNNFHVDASNSGEDIMFRTINVEINYQ